VKVGKKETSCNFVKKSIDASLRAKKVPAVSTQKGWGEGRRNSKRGRERLAASRPAIKETPRL